MKKFLLAFSFILGFALIGVNNASAQCSPNMSISAPGISPDTLRDGCQGSAYADTISFMFPVDTTVQTPIGPFTVTFDSFTVSQVLNIPAGLAYQCNISSCVYVTNPPNPTIGCVSIGGVPTDTTMPGDSVDVIGDAWVTLFGQATSFSDTFRLGIRIAPAGVGACPVSIDPSLLVGTSLDVFPNPVEAGSQVRFELAKAAEVEVALYSMMGRKLAVLDQGYRATGEHNVTLKADELPAGIYYVKMTLNDGAASLTRKVVSVR